MESAKSVRKSDLYTQRLLSQDGQRPVESTANPEYSAEFERVNKISLWIRDRIDALIPLENDPDFEKQQKNRIGVIDNALALLEEYRKRLSFLLENDMSARDLSISLRFKLTNFLGNASPVYKETAPQSSSMPDIQQPHATHILSDELLKALHLKQGTQMHAILTECRGLAFIPREVIERHIGDEKHATAYISSELNRKLKGVGLKAIGIMPADIVIGYRLISLNGNGAEQAADNTAGVHRRVLTLDPTAKQSPEKYPYGITKIEVVGTTRGRLEELERHSRKWTVRAPQAFLTLLAEASRTNMREDPDTGESVIVIQRDALVRKLGGAGNVDTRIVSNCFELVEALGEKLCTGGTSKKVVIAIFDNYDKQERTFEIRSSE